MCRRRKTTKPAPDTHPQHRTPHSSPLFGDEYLAFFHDNSFLVEPQPALRIGFLHQPHTPASRLFPVRQLALGKKVLNLLLVHSYRDRIANRCRARVQPLSYYVIVISVRAVGRAAIAEFSPPELDPCRRIRGNVFTIFTTALLVYSGPFALGTACIIFVVLHPAIFPEDHFTVPTGSVEPSITFTVASATAKSVRAVTRKSPARFGVSRNSSPSLD